MSSYFDKMYEEDKYDEDAEEKGEDEEDAEDADGDEEQDVEDADEDEEQEQDVEEDGDEEEDDDEDAEDAEDNDEGDTRQSDRLSAFGDAGQFGGEKRKSKSTKTTKKISVKTPYQSSNVLNDNMDNNDNDDDDDDDNDGEDYLQKFDKSMDNNYIVDFHPESVLQNFDEILSMINVIRDNDGIIIDDLHRTIPFLTKYEKSRVLGQRAKQINSGCPPFVKIPENVIDGYIIAQLELKEKKMPFIIRRPMPSGGSEYWSIKDLEDISF